MRTKRFAHVIGFDDAPFSRTHRGDVLVVGAIYSNCRLEGIVSGKVRRDGVNATRTLVRLVTETRFSGHIQVVLLQGIAFAGFNVIDLHGLHDTLELPVIAVARKQPNLNAIRDALLNKVPGGARKWSLIHELGPMERIRGVFVQRAGISIQQVDALFRRLSVNSNLPEPLRTAHMIAGGVTLGESKHRA